MTYENELTKIGIIGLGKMGLNLAQNIKDNGIEVFAYNRTKEKLEAVEKLGITGIYAIKDLVKKLDDTKVVWMMVPEGKPVDDVLQKLVPLLDYGDIIIDGGNSNYKDTIRRSQILEEEGIRLIDVGTSGGIYGARNGACMMVGGDIEAVRYIEPLLKNICVDGGYEYIGKSGSGHFVKMIHNGIEYGMMEAIGEGFQILNSSKFEFDYEKIARVWNSGSIIRGYLMEVTEKAFEQDKKLESIRGEVDSSGEGLWTVEEALNLKVPAPVITSALFSRYRSKQLDSFSGKVVAAQRNQFGGHAVHKNKGE